MTNEQIAPAWTSLLFGVRRSIRYHNYRRKFFDSLGMWSDFLTIVSGGGVVWFANRAAPETTPIMICGALAGLSSAFDLVVGFSTRARDHSDFSRQFTHLEQEMNSIGDAPTECQLKEKQNARLEIEANEPPIYRVLDTYCHNELLRALGYPAKEQVKLGFWQRSLMQFGSIQPHKLGL